MSVPTVRAGPFRPQASEDGTDPKGAQMAVLTDRLIVIDGHVDVARTDAGWDFPIDAAIAGGVNAVVIPARASLTPRTAAGETAELEREETYAGLAAAVDAAAGTAAFAHSPAEVVANIDREVLSVILGFQNARGLADLDDIRRWIDRGVSVFDFGFAGSNEWVESSRPYPHASVGSTATGIGDATRDAIALLNARGVVIDTAQVSDRARRQIVDASAAPVIASHNGVKSKVPGADRALSDGDIVAVADKGGIVQIVAFDGYHTPRGENPRVVADIRELRERFGLPGFVSQSDYYALLDPESADWDEQKFNDYFHEYHAKVRHGWPRTDLDRFVDSVEYVADLAGIDHVGIASDFHHGGGVQGWLSPTDTPNVTAALRRRFDDHNVAKIWGGNFLRVWDSVRAAGER